MEQETSESQGITNENAKGAVLSMDLLHIWNQYEETGFNSSDLPESVLKQGVKIEYEPKSLIVSSGEFPQYIYFIQSGIASGVREYADGNEYSYFQIDSSNGNIGLLELLARKNGYIATIMSVTKVVTVKIESVIIYTLIMNDISLLRRCTALLADDLYSRSGNDGILYYLQGIDRVRFYYVTYCEKYMRENGPQNRITVEAEYQDIARQIGVSVRTVGRNIQKLKEAGEITSVRKKITLTQAQYRNMRDKIYI